MNSSVGQEPAGRGRDLALMTLDVVTGSAGKRTFTSVLCPKERRARPAAECAACVDGRGPVVDPMAMPGYLACVAPVVDASAADWQAGDPPPSVADRTAVSALMSRAVLALRADVPLDDARATLLQREVAGAPVVDDDGRPVGMLSLAELVEAGAAPGRRVGDAMVRRVFTVADRAPVSEVAALMAFEDVGRVPVVSREGRVVGIVTALDIVRWLAAQDDRGARHLP